MFVAPAQAQRPEPMSTMKHDNENNAQADDSRYGLFIENVPEKDFTFGHDENINVESSQASGAKGMYHFAVLIMPSYL